MAPKPAAKTTPATTTTTGAAAKTTTSTSSTTSSTTTGTQNISTMSKAQQTAAATRAQNDRSTAAATLTSRIRHKKEISTTFENLDAVAVEDSIRVVDTTHLDERACIGIKKFEGTHGLTASVTSNIAVSHNGKWIATGSNNGTVAIYSTADDSRKLVKLIDAVSPGPIRFLRFSPDSKYLATVPTPLPASSSKPAESPCVQLFNCDTQTKHQKLVTGHKGAITSIEFSLDSRLLGTSSRDAVHGVGIWMISTGRSVGTLDNGHVSDVLCCSFGAKGHIATGGVDKRVVLWNSSSLAKIHQMSTDAHTAPVICLSFTLTGELLASGSQDTTAIIWDVFTGTKKFVLKNSHKASITGVVFSSKISDNTLLTCSAFDKTIRAWNVSTGQERNSAKFANFPLLSGVAANSMSYIKNGSDVNECSTVYFCDSSNVFELHVTQGRPVTEPIKRESAVKSLEFSDNGAYLTSIDTLKKPHVFVFPNKKFYCNATSATCHVCSKHYDHAPYEWKCSNCQHRPLIWLPDEKADKCCRCSCSFTIFTRKHHCRSCNYHFCANCLSTALIWNDTELFKVCLGCLAKGTSLEQAQEIQENEAADFALIDGDTDFEDFLMVARPEEVELRRVKVEARRRAKAEAELASFRDQWKHKSQQQQQQQNHNDPNSENTTSAAGMVITGKNILVPSAVAEGQQQEQEQQQEQIEENEQVSHASSPSRSNTQQQHQHGSKEDLIRYQQQQLQQEQKEKEQANTTSPDSPLSPKHHDISAGRLSVIEMLESCAKAPTASTTTSSNDNNSNNNNNNATAAAAASSSSENDDEQQRQEEEESSSSTNNNNNNIIQLTPQQQALNDLNIIDDTQEKIRDCEIGIVSVCSELEEQVEQKERELLEIVESLATQKHNEQNNNNNNNNNSSSENNTTTSFDQHVAQQQQEQKQHERDLAARNFLESFEKWEKVMCDMQRMQGAMITALECSANSILTSLVARKAAVLQQEDIVVPTDLFVCLKNVSDSMLKAEKTSMSCDERIYKAVSESEITFKPGSRPSEIVEAASVACSRLNNTMMFDPSSLPEFDSHLSFPVTAMDDSLVQSQSNDLSRLTSTYLSWRQEFLKIQEQCREKFTKLDHLYKIATQDRDSTVEIVRKHVTEALNSVQSACFLMVSRIQAILQSFSRLSNFKDAVEDAVINFKQTLQEHEQACETIANADIEVVKLKHNREMSKEQKAEENRKISLNLAKTRRQQGKLLPRLVSQVTLLYPEFRSKIDAATTAFLDSDGAVSGELALDSFNVDMNNPLSQAGEGARHNVYKATLVDGDPNQFFVLKQYRLDERFYKEVRMLSRLSHRYVMPILSAFISSSSSDGANSSSVGYIMMPFVAGGEFGDFANFHREKNPHQVNRVIHNLFEALAHLHAAFVIHSDLKPQNILMSDKTPNASPLLIDFDASKNSKEIGQQVLATAAATRVSGTFKYMAPEVVDFMSGGDISSSSSSSSSNNNNNALNQITTAIDIYSFAIVILEAKIPNFSVQPGVEVKIPPNNSSKGINLSEDERDMLQGMLQRDPKKENYCRSLFETLCDELSSCCSTA